jgi:two-component system, LytTR family, response regulator
MALRTVVVEDEVGSRDRLRRLLARHTAEVVVVAEAETGPLAVQTINEQEPDLVLLDVSLPGFGGFDVLAQLAVEPAVIFTTAHDEYAVRAFRANAADYLLKPIDPDHLAAAIAKVARLRAPPRQAGWADVMAAIRDARSQELRRIACRVGDATIFVGLDEIQYFRADTGYTLVKTNDQEYLVDTPLTDLEGRLDARDFVRIHRNALVNLNFVGALRRSGDGRLRVVLKDGSELLSSRRYAENLRTLG